MLRQKGQQVARVDVVLDERSLVFARKPDASPRARGLAQKKGIGPVEGLAVAPVYAKAANGDPRLGGDAGSEVVFAPIVGVRPRGRRERVGEIAARRERLGKLPRLPFGSAGQVFSIPRRDDGDSAGTTGYLRDSVSRRSLCRRFTSFSRAASRKRSPRFTDKLSRSAAISDRFTWR